MIVRIGLRTPYHRWMTHLTLERVVFLSTRSLGSNQMVRQVANEEWVSIALELVEVTPLDRNPGHHLHPNRRMNRNSEGVP